MADRCEFCSHGKWVGPSDQPPAHCHVRGCPGNPETDSPEDGRLLVRIRDAVVAEACFYRGIKEPKTGGEYTRIEDIFRYAQAALREVRKFDAEKTKETV